MLGCNWLVTRLGPDLCVRTQTHEAVGLMAKRSRFPRVHATVLCDIKSGVIQTEKQKISAAFNCFLVEKRRYSSHVALKPLYPVLIKFEPLSILITFISVVL